MQNEVISISENVLNGTPVFKGTRVPIKNLFDYIEEGATIEEFLIAFPSVKKEHAIEVLEIAERLVESTKLSDEVTA
ncbi:MAG: DUF433 domain-containing protein [Bacteroidota bacterium]